MALRVGVEILRLGVDLADDVGVDLADDVGVDTAVTTREIGAKDPYLGETGVDFLTALIFLIVNALGSVANGEPKPESNLEYPIESNLLYDLLDAIPQKPFSQ